ncbi:MAG: Fic family protein [Lachnospiraceae bacterium]|nr:Fic family protein [Lachnospiraceae bacterium]
MRDIYLYEDSDVLKNLLNIKDKTLLDEAEADYVTYRLKEIAMCPLPGDYDYAHLLKMHQYIFQDIYEWAGKQRKLNIYKEEPVLGGLSVDYSDLFDIPKDSERVLSEMRDKAWKSMDKHEAAIQFSDSLAKLWRVHPFREGNTRTTVTFCCQYADAVGLNPNRELFEDNAQYVRTALVAYNAVFDDLGNKSKPEYLIKIVEDSITRDKW